MKQLIKFTLVLMAFGALVLTGCSSSKKGQCGCPGRSGVIIN
ncbi:MAG TPA: hypothetical protein PKK69_00325 [Ferruginibacter sp.]|jgi:outer membrane murein-binding lipoprotein Lpp|nr:hypothetical protein [Ferruginibacter sp.]